MPRRTRRSRSRTLLNIAAFIAVVAGAAYGVTLIQPFPSFNFSTGRRHLHQIPIDRGQACREVEAMHAQLDAFAQSYMAATLGADPKALNALWRGAEAAPASSLPYQPQSWPVVEAELEVAAQQLDSALEHGVPHFPKRIRSQLMIVRSSIAAGRKALVAVDNVQSFNTLTRRPFARGQLHAGYASDLVGRQCRVPLGA